MVMQANENEPALDSIPLPIDKPMAALALHAAKMFEHLSPAELAKAEVWLQEATKNFTAITLCTANSHKTLCAMVGFVFCQKMRELQQQHYPDSAAAQPSKESSDG